MYMNYYAALKSVKNEMLKHAPKIISPFLSSMQAKIEKNIKHMLMLAS